MMRSRLTAGGLSRTTSPDALRGPVREMLAGCMIAETFFFTSAVLPQAFEKLFALVF